MITTNHLLWFKFTFIKFKNSFPQTTGHISSNQKAHVAKDYHIGQCS